MTTVRLLHNIGSLHHESYNTPEEIQNCTDILTFDGIYSNVYEHKDLLRGKDVILFVMGDCVGKDNSFDDGAPQLETYCTWKEVEELVAMGCKLGWHTWSHPDLTTISEEQLIHEVTPPFPMDYFAYPYGKFNDNVIKAVKEAGFKEAFSVIEGDNSQFQRLRPYL